MARMCKNGDYDYVEVIDSEWYYPFPRCASCDIPLMVCIGIVKMRDTRTNKIYCRIGYASGLDKELDEDNIVASGVKIDGGFFIK